MRKIFFLLIFGLFTSVIFSQNQASFPYKVKLRDANGKKVSSEMFSNYKNGLVVVFVEAVKVNHWGKKPEVLKYVPHYSYLFLNDLENSINRWNNKYKTKTVVIFHSKKIEKKKITELIKEKNWNFEYYFNTNKKLYKKITKTNLINIQAVSIFDENFKNIFNNNIKPKYNRFFCKTKNGNWKEYCINKDNELIKQHGVLKETEEILELASIRKQNKLWQEQ